MDAVVRDEPETLAALGIVFARADVAGLTAAVEHWEATIGKTSLTLTRYENGRWMAHAYPAEASIHAHGHAETPEDAIRALAPSLVRAADLITSISLDLATATAEVSR